MFAIFRPLHTKAGECNCVFLPKTPQNDKLSPELSLFMDNSDENDEVERGLRAGWNEGGKGAQPGELNYVTTA